MQASYSCGVANCGQGSCVHQVLERNCPECGKPLILATTTGWVYCSNHTLYCEYEECVLPPAKRKVKK